MSQNGETNVINFAQTRTISVKRFIRLVGKIGDEDFEKAKNIFKALL
jgi:hypothetical protein